MITCRMCDKPLMYNQKFEEWVHTENKENHCLGKASTATPDNLCPSRYYWWGGEAEGTCELEKDHTEKHTDHSMEWEDDDEGVYP